jgi:hypothetical protein
MFNVRDSVYGYYLNESISDDMLFVLLYGDFLLNDGLLHPFFFFPFIAFQSSLLSSYQELNLQL